MEISGDKINKDYYKTRYTFDPKRKKVWKAIVENLQERFIGHDAVVLDLGCGYGDFINQVKASRKLAIDCENVGCFLDSNIEFFQEDVKKLNFLEDCSLDIVFASNLLEHLVLEDISLVLEELKQKLKPEGKLILIQPNFKLCYKNYFDDYTHRTIFTDVSLSGMLTGHGYSVKYKRASYLPFSIKSILPKSYWLTRFYLNLNLPFLGKQMLVVSENSKN